MHHNARIHTAKFTTKWLKDNNIEVTEWPPYSLDLNLIENLWLLLKAAIYKRCRDLPTIQCDQKDLAVLIERAKLVCNNILDEIINKLIITIGLRAKVGVSFASAPQCPCRRICLISILLAGAVRIECVWQCRVQWANGT